MRVGLQAVLALLGGVAVTFGLLTVVTGAASVPAGGAVTASVDSELRFYAAWYVAAGATLLWAAPNIDRAGTVLRLVCATLWLAAAGRIVSLAAVGRPHGVFVVLLAVEIVIPLVVVPWQAAVASRRVRPIAGR